MDDLRERVARALAPVVLPYIEGYEEVPPDHVWTRPRYEWIALAMDRIADAALSATPIEALQQRVERLEVALRGLLSSYIGTCRFNGRVISEIEQHHCVIDARAALGDDVG